MITLAATERRARRLAEALTPLLQQHLALGGREMLPVDKRTLDAARKVAEAVNDLDQTKFAGGREVAARRALERAARSLRTQLKNREAKRGGK